MMPAIKYKSADGKPEICSIIGCGRKMTRFNSKYYCRTHFDRISKNIDLNLPVVTGRQFNCIVKEAIEHPSIKDIYWAAAIVEGEGCIIFGKGKYISVSVYQKDTWILHKLTRMFGGSIYYRKQDERRFGKCDSLWRVSGPRGRGFIMTIFSILSPNKQKRVIEGMVKWLGRGDLCQE